jgi:hypothetical protein
VEDGKVSERRAEEPVISDIGSAQEPSLEQKVLKALTEDGMASSELADLLQETDAGIAEAERQAVAAREAAYDPARSPDLSKAREEMEDTALLVGRLKTMRPSAHPLSADRRTGSV